MLLAVWSCHLALLIPLLGLTEHPHYPADRYSYVQGICWSVVIASGLLLLQRVNGSHKTIVVIFATAVVGWFGWRAHRQTFVWNNSVSLFRHILGRLEEDRYKADIYHRLGAYYAERGDAIKAVQQYTEALSVNPAFLPALKSRGLLRLSTGAILEALVDLEEAHAIQSDAEVSQGLSVAYAQTGQPDLALQHCNEAIRLDPNDAITYLNCAVFLTSQGKFAEAVEYLQKALQLDPDNQDSRLLLSRLTVPLGNPPAPVP
jgi:tetratricopeptide (TPR) repeat protein